MNSTDLTTLTWRKSSYTSEEQCVEVAYPANAVAVRDSKDPEGPALLVSPSAFASLLDTLRTSGSQ